MAAKSTLLIISLLSIFFFSPTTLVVVVSRSLLLERAPETAIFDVSASIQKSIDVLNFNPQQFHQNEQQFVQSPPSSSLSVPLLSRSAVETNVYKTYTDLTISRLERDSIRVKWILSKLDLKLKGVKRCNKLLPFEAEKLQAPLTSGSSQGSAEYFTRIGVGSPAKPMYLTIDTGSDLTWLQCKPCTDCYPQTDPIFDPSASASYVPLMCGTTACMYSETFVDGSHTKGTLARETLSFGSSGSITNAVIGCGHDNRGLFVGSAGVFGLGGGVPSLPSQIKATSFSYCLVNRDSSSSSTLEFNSPRPADSITTPIIRNNKITNTSFYVGLTGLSVGGKMLSIPQSLFEINESGDGGVIVDSGTIITRLPTEAYNILRDSFKMKVQNLTAAPGFSLFDTCYDISGRTSVVVPTLSFNFAGGKELKLVPNNYLLLVRSTTFCFAFAGWSSSQSIIGNKQQQGMRVSYDLTNSVIGFSPGKC